MHQQRIALFDCADTLVFYHPLREDIFLNLCRKHIPGLTKRSVRLAYRIAESSMRDRGNAAANADNEEFNRQLFLTLGNALIGKKLATKIPIEFTRRGAWKLFPRVREALRYAETKGYRLGVVSNWNRHLPLFLQSLGIAHYFDLILSSAMIRSAKPESKIFEEASQRLSLRRGDIIYYVGNDYETDVVWARKFGMRPILYDWRHRYPHADCPRITRWRDLPRYL